MKETITAWIIQTEIWTVISFLRKSNGWFSLEHGKVATEEDQLLKNFKALISLLYSNLEAPESLELLFIVQPFLEVIRCEFTSGPVTGVALSSINKFLVTGILANLHNYARGIAAIAEAVTRTRFVFTNAESDEVVLMKLLQVLKTILTSASGTILPTRTVLDAIQAVYGICYRSSLSELLGKCAEQTLKDIVVKLFGRLSELEDDTALDDQPAESVERSNLEGSSAAVSIFACQPTEVEDADMLEKEVSALNSDVSLSTTLLSTVLTDLDSKGRPYGLHCVRKVFLFLLLILRKDPTDHYSSVLLGVELVTSCLEVSGKILSRIDCIFSLVETKLCHRLLCILRGSKLPLFTLALRSWFLLVVQFRVFLKYQLQHFLRTFLALFSSGSFSLGHQEVALDTLKQLLRADFFEVELFVNFDCDLYSANVLSDILCFLSRRSLNAGAITGSLRFLFLETLHLILEKIELRSAKQKALSSAQKFSEGSRPAPPYSMLPTLESITALRKQKEVLAQAVKLFNKRPQEGVEFMIKHSLVASPSSSRSDYEDSLIALFIKLPQLKKSRIGEYLGSPENKQLIYAYARLFDFRRERCDQSLRRFLQGFRLPGESQVIYRFMESFSAIYYSMNKDAFANEDAVLAHAYAIIMLNVDQHSRQIRNKMTVEEFIQNQKGINSGSDLDRDYLIGIYNSIRESEIVISDQLTGQAAEDYEWEQVLLKSQDVTSSKYVMAATDLYDSELYEVVCGPAVEAFLGAFDSTADSDSIQLSVSGLRLCAALAAHFQNSRVFDTLISSLSDATSLCTEKTDLNFSTLACNFGMDHKGQLAAVTLFSLVREHGSVMRTSWENVIRCVQQLFFARLLPENLLLLHDLSSNKKVLLQQAPMESYNQHGGIFASLAYYLSTHEVTIAEAQKKKNLREAAEECVRLCRIPEIFLSSSKLESTSFEYFYKALFSSLSLPVKCISAPQNKVHKAPSSHDTLKSRVYQLAQEESKILFLELLTNTILDNEKRPTLPDLSALSHLASIIETCTANQRRLKERAVVCYLRLCASWYPTKELTPVNVLNAVDSGDTSLLLQMFGGILHFISINGHLIESKAEWEILLSLSVVDSFLLSHENSVALAILKCIVDKFINVFSFEPFVREVARFITNFKSELSRQKRPTCYQQSPLYFFNLCLEATSRALSICSSADVWPVFNRTLLETFAKMTRYSDRSIRMNALSLIQRALLLPSCRKMTKEQWRQCFYEILFPVLEALLSSDMDEVDPEAIDESRFQAANLLCKTCLTHIQELLLLEDFFSLWKTVLEYLEQCSSENNSLYLRESVLESLKNMLFVLVDNGFLQSGSPEGETELTKQTLSEVTWAKVNGFMPQLREELLMQALLPAKAPEAGVHQESHEEKLEVTAFPEGSNLVPKECL